MCELFAHLTYQHWTSKRANSLNSTDSISIFFKVHSLANEQRNASTFEITVFAAIPVQSIGRPQRKTNKFPVVIQLPGNFLFAIWYTQFIFNEISLGYFTHSLIYRTGQDLPSSCVYSENLPISCHTPLLWKSLEN